MTSADAVFLANAAPSALKCNRQDRWVHGETHWNRSRGMHMEHVVWDENFSVGVREFDEEHRRLLDLLFMLQDTIQGNKDKDSLQLVLQGLIDYAVQHCTHEEHVLRAHGYPDLETHRAEHSHLLHMLSEFREDLREDDSNLAERVHEFLRRWLRSHVRNTDRRYKEFLNERGIT